MIGEDAPATTALVEKYRELPSAEAISDQKASTHLIAATIHSKLVHAQTFKLLDSVRTMDTGDGNLDVLDLLLDLKSLESYESFIATVGPEIEAAQREGVAVEPVYLTMFEEHSNKVEELRAAREVWRQNPLVGPIIDARAEVRDRITEILCLENKVRGKVASGEFVQADIQKELAALPVESRAYLANYFRKRSEKGDGSEIASTCPDVERLKEIGQVLNDKVAHINFSGGDLTARCVVIFLGALEQGDYVEADKWMGHFSERFGTNTVKHYRDLEMREQQFLDMAVAYFEKPEPKQRKGFGGAFGLDSPEFSAWFLEGGELIKKIATDSKLRNTVRMRENFILGYQSNWTSPELLGYMRTCVNIYRNMAEACEIMAHARDKGSELHGYLSRGRCNQVAGILQGVA